MERVWRVRTFFNGHFHVLGLALVNTGQVFETRSIGVVGVRGKEAVGDSLVKGSIKRRSGIDGSTLGVSMSQTLLAPETGECKTNRKSLSAKRFDHTGQRNWWALILGVYLPINERRGRRRSARPAPKSRRTTYLIPLGG